MNDFVLGMLFGILLTVVMMTQVLRKLFFDLLWLTGWCAVLLARGVLLVVFALCRAFCAGVGVFVETMHERMSDRGGYDDDWGFEVTCRFEN